MNTETYFNNLGPHKVILVDFDDTCVFSKYPEIGDNIPGAAETLRELQRKGHKIILFTQRTEDALTKALGWFVKEGINLFGINDNREWEIASGDTSRKIFGDYTIDDHSVGMKYLPGTEACDWNFIRDWLITEGVL